MLFLDTNVVVDLLRKRSPRLRDNFAAACASDSPLAISSIVLFELRFGAHNSQRPEANMRALEAFLDDTGITVVTFNAADAAQAAEIRAGLSQAGALIGPYDILIAAQARARGAILVTANRREFERVPGLMVTDWTA
ncbi:type II toxin-antitoxin system VapC family toxin [Rhodopseudomonas palustris]|uniref:Ribonuclease VapC n=1 Tax=Rhodopseudomonas palustris TaxID=1076 RepID=A0A323UBQ3_RHOPL|nr:type II toxin-antitoxin system VapC family toxin [Rhodopseudomonas palustris]PZA09679.1 type II toxin-antitoxin system VapC family toxin [Rhodopseudomonas palustris]